MTEIIIPRRILMAGDDIYIDGQSRQVIETQMTRMQIGGEAQEAFRIIVKEPPKEVEYSLDELREARLKRLR